MSFRWECLPKRALRDQARKYCALMLLDYIEERDGVRKGDLARAASLSGYCELFSQIMRDRGWLGLSQFRSRHGFDSKLQHGIQNAKSLAEAIDLVCRSAQEGGQPLSLALAEKVSRSRFKEVEPGGAGPAKSLAYIEEESVLSYVLLTHCSELLPPVLKKESFADQLLQQVGDIASLQDLFSAYNRVSALLQPTSQRLLRPLLLNGDKTETSVRWRPLDAETRNLIDRHAGFRQSGLPSARNRAV
jgi:hypothetical protein